MLLGNNKFQVDGIWTTNCVIMMKSSHENTNKQSWDYVPTPMKSPSITSFLKFYMYACLLYVMPFAIMLIVWTYYYSLITNVCMKIKGQGYEFNHLQRIIYNGIFSFLATELCLAFCGQWVCGPNSNNSLRKPCLSNVG